MNNRDFKWIHLSDVHFHSGNNSATISTIREKLLRCLKGLHGIPDIRFAFITGDVAERGVYDSATDKWMKNLIRELRDLGIEDDHILWCAGNHDIPRTGEEYSVLRTLAVHAIRAQDKFDVSVDDIKTRKLLFWDGMSTYYNHYSAYLPHFEEISREEEKCLWGHRFYNYPELNVIVLNTCITSCDDDDEKRLRINEERLREIFNLVDTRKPTFVIGHHNLDFFEEDDRKGIEVLFDDFGVDLYLCGHSHRQSIESRLMKNVIYVATCGAVSADSYAQNVFYLGSYRSIEHAFHLTPYWFISESQTWCKNYGRDRALGESTWYTLKRFAEQRADDDKTPFPCGDEAKNDFRCTVLEGSRREFEKMRNSGAFRFLEIDDSIIPGATDERRQIIDTFVSADSGDVYTDTWIDLLKITERVLCKVNGVLLTGEGGTGKTTSLLRIWEEELQKEDYVPIYIPLNKLDSSRQETDEFIMNYCKLKYGFDLRELENYKIRFLLLLDGFNEISVNPDKAAGGIRNLMLRFSRSMKCIITSRNEERMSFLLDFMNRYYLLPLTDSAIEGYLEQRGIEVKKNLFYILQVPMMLTLYARTCFIQGRLDSQLTFMDADSSAAIIYNYLLCQIGKLWLDGQNSYILETFRHLFYIAPYIANCIEKDGKFAVSPKALRSLSDEASKLFEREYVMSQAENALGKLVWDSEPRDCSVYDVLEFRQHLLVQEEGGYYFCHQYFRDFFSAYHILNMLREDEDACLQLLKERKLSQNIIKMLCNLINMESLSRLSHLFDSLRGQKRQDFGFSLDNLISVVNARALSDNQAFCYKWLGGLDFSGINLNAIHFSRNIDFTGSALFRQNFIPDGHTNSVTCVCLVPQKDGGEESGDILLTASLDGTVKEWDMRYQTCIRTYGSASDDLGDNRKNNIKYIACFPDGRSFVSVSTLGEVKEWSRETGMCVCRYGSHGREAVNYVCISPDAVHFITAGEDKTVWEWERGCEESIFGYQGDANLLAAVYSRDGRIIAAGSQKGRVTIWKRRVNQPKIQFNAHNKAIHDLAFNKDGTCLLTASTDTFVHEWEIGDQEAMDGVWGTPSKKRTYKNHREVVNYVRYVKEDTEVLTASNDSTVIIWNCASGQVFRKYRDQHNRVNSVLLTADGKRLISGSHSGEIVMNDVETGICTGIIKNADFRVCRAVASEDGYVFTAGTDGVIRKWDLEGQHCVRSYYSSDTPVRGLYYSWQQDRLYSCAEDGSVTVRDAASDGVYWEAQVDFVPSMLAMASDESRFIIAGRSVIVEFGADGSGSRYTYASHEAYVTGICYLTPTRFLSTSKDGTVRLWESKWGSEEDKSVQMVGGEESKIVYQSADGRYPSAISIAEDMISAESTAVLVSEGADMVVLDADTWEPMRWNRLHDRLISDITFCKEKKLMLTGGDDNILRLWEVGGWYKCIRTFTGHRGRISSVAFIEDATKLISSSFDGTICLWDTKTGNQIWQSRPYGGINIAGCRFRDCRFEEGLEAVIREMGGIL